MNRSPRTRSWIGVTVVVAFLASLVFTISAVDAQDNSEPSLSMTVSPVDATQPFRTFGVALDAGDAGLAALGATIRFDPALIVASSCSVSEAGACNATEAGQVLVSVFNLGGLKSNDQLLTVNFEAAPGATGTATLDLTVDTAVSFQGLEISVVETASIEIELAPVEFGSLTGDVIDSESTAGLFALDVCVSHELTQSETCTTSSGLGTWRIDDLAVGAYTVVVSDPAGVYTPSATVGTVLAEQVTAGVDSAMTLVADEAESEDDAEPGDGNEDDAPPTAGLELSELTVVTYEASIAGRVTALDTADPLEALQVCATQPLVLHQSCATTDADGAFALAGLSTGNYWITIVDPLGQFEEARPKLVGVVGDDVARTGVQIRLTRIAG